MTFELGFDIGGTFTDFALLNTESGELASIQSADYG